MYREDIGPFWPTIRRRLQEEGRTAGDLETELARGDDIIDKTVVQPLLAAIPTSSRQALDQIPVGTLLTLGHDVNAYAITSPDRTTGPVVILNWSLFLFLGAVVPPTLALAFAPQAQKKEIAQWIKDSVAEVTSGHKRGRIAVHDYEPTVAHMAFAIQVGVLAFVVGHEYAHVICGHLDPGNVNASLAGFAKYNKTQEQELVADIEGLRLVRPFLDGLEADMFQGERPAAFPRACPLITMSIFRFLTEEFGDADSSSTHPPPAERRLRLRTAIRPPLSDLANSIAEFFDRVLSHSEEATQYMETG
jgi:hypothetical protein